jgi:hypothetical protein
MNSKAIIIRRTALAGAAALLLSPVGALADSNIGVGVWGTYQYIEDNEANNNSGGELTGEALIIYADGEADDEGKWFYSAEMRFGPGSFTDPANNSTGDQMTIHKAWVGWKLDDNHVVRVGKSQVPFAWKTMNFWPGDMLQAGYGDQMDVGVKLSGSQGAIAYDAAYYLADDWGSTSTDTVDDNGHWGSSTTFRKVKTFVGNITWEFAENQKLGFSAQSGQLQDLSGVPGNPTSGDHDAYAFYFDGTYGNFFGKAEYITGSRELPTAFRTSAGLPDEVKNSRIATLVGYNMGDWAFYLDASFADPDTDGNTAGSVRAFAPGIRYDYGPGWVYVEYLTQDGFVDRNGMVGEGDFDALYISMDFYL